MFCPAAKKKKKKKCLCPNIYGPNYTHVDFHNFQNWHISKYRKDFDLDISYIKTIFWVH